MKGGQTLPTKHPNHPRRAALISSSFPKGDTDAQILLLTENMTLWTHVDVAKRPHEWQVATTRSWNSSMKHVVAVAIKQISNTWHANKTNHITRFQWVFFASPSGSRLCDYDIIFKLVNSCNPFINFYCFLFLGNLCQLLLQKLLSCRSTLQYLILQHHFANPLPWAQQTSQVSSRPLIRWSKNGRSVTTRIFTCVLGDPPQKQPSFASIASKQANPIPVPPWAMNQVTFERETEFIVAKKHVAFDALSCNWSDVPCHKFNPTHVTATGMLYYIWCFLVFIPTRYMTTCISCVK